MKDKQTYKELERLYEQAIKENKKDKKGVVMKCGQKTEIYSRVVGYFRPVSNWNKGKREEFKERAMFKTGFKTKKENER